MSPDATARRLLRPTRERTRPVQETRFPHSTSRELGASRRAGAKKRRRYTCHARPHEKTPGPFRICCPVRDRLVHLLACGRVPAKTKARSWIIEVQSDRPNCRVRVVLAKDSFDGQRTDAFR